MEDLIIYGSGGMAREVVQLVEDINAVNPTWNILGFTDDIKGDCGEIINGYRILGTGEVLNSLGTATNVVLAMSDPAVKEKIHRKIRKNNVKFPVLVHPSSRIAKNVSIGEGTIIGIDCIVSVNASLGKHVFLNMRTVIGHDAVIKDYSSCLVNCIIAGDVVVNEGTLIGSNSVIMEKKVIGRRARIAMGSCVSFDVEDEHVVLNKPSKSMYFGKRDLKE